MAIDHTPSYYSEEQLRCYLVRIRYPGFAEDWPLPDATYDTLCKLMIGHLTTFPYENVDMHYTEEHLMRVAPADAYQRQVVRGQGGWCCAQNGICLGMLRALGYPAYAGAGRVNRFLGAEVDIPAEYKALCHMVLFVEPEGMSTQIVDVGFGGGGLTGPIELRDGAEVPGASGERVRLKRSSPPGSVRPADDAWVLSSKRPDKDFWKDLYQFSQTELTLADLEALSYAVCMRPRMGAFWVDVVAFQFKIVEGTESREGGPELWRLVLNAGKVTEDRKEGKKVVRICKDEEDRVEVLREYFGLIVKKEDIHWIDGRDAAMASRATLDATKDNIAS